MKRGLSVLAFLVLWEVLPRLGAIDPLLLPPPSEVFLRGWELLLAGELLGHVGASLWRVMVGFSLAALIALPLGTTLGLLPGLEQYVDSLVHLFRPLAPPAWIPLAILWFGIGDAPAIFIIFMGTFFTMLLGILSATRGVKKDLVKVGLTLGATPRQAVFHIVLPSLTPAIFTQLRIGLALAWMCVVASEMVAVDDGIGFMMIEARNLFRTEDVLLGMVVVGALGFSLDLAIRKVEGRVLRWTKGTSAHELFTGLGRP